MEGFHWRPSHRQSPSSETADRHWRPSHHHPPSAESRPAWAAWLLFPAPFEMAMTTITTGTTITANTPSIPMNQNGWIAKKHLLSLMRGVDA